MCVQLTNNICKTSDEVKFIAGVDFIVRCLRRLSLLIGDRLTDRILFIVYRLGYRRLSDPDYVYKPHKHS